MGREANANKAAATAMRLEIARKVRDKIMDSAGFWETVDRLVAERLQHEDTTCATIYPDPNGRHTVELALCGSEAPESFPFEVADPFDYTPGVPDIHEVRQFAVACRRLADDIDAVARRAEDFVEVHNQIPESGPLLSPSKFSVRVFNGMRMGGITTEGQLRAYFDRYGVEGLQRLPTFGRKAAQDVEDYLAGKPWHQDSQRGSE